MQASGTARAENSKRAKHLKDVSSGKCMKSQDYPLASQNCADWSSPQISKAMTGMSSSSPRMISAAN